jgi:hypothetical protein
VKKAFFTLVVLSLAVYVGSAHADSSGHGAKEFYSVIDSYRESCNEACYAPFNNEAVFDIHNPNQSQIAANVQESLSKVALVQAQIWGDTILEGDYYSAGQTQLDYVVALFQDNALIGYKITYSERAWFIGDCDFNGSDEDVLKSCREGRIHESTFVSPDFKTFFRDDEDFAGFED